MYTIPLIIFENVPTFQIQVYHMERLSSTFQIQVVKGKIVFPLLGLDRGSIIFDFVVETGIASSGSQQLYYPTIVVQELACLPHKWCNVQSTLKSGWNGNRCTNILLKLLSAVICERWRHYDPTKMPAMVNRRWNEIWWLWYCYRETSKKFLTLFGTLCISVFALSSCLFGYNFQNHHFLESNQPQSNTSSTLTYYNISRQARKPDTFVYFLLLDLLMGEKDQNHSQFRIDDLYWKRVLKQ